MGKKKKVFDTKLSDEELIPVTIGELDENKTSTIMLFIFFAIFVVFAVYLPTISTYVANYFHKDSLVDVGDKPEKPDKPDTPDTPDVKESVLYDYGEELAFTVDGLKLDKFSIKSNTIENTHSISFTVENTTSKNIDFNIKKYFIEIYDGNKTLLGRAIFNNNIIGKSENLKMNLPISSDAAQGISKISVMEKNLKDYPLFELKDTYVLTCTNSHETIEYKYNSGTEIDNISESVKYLNDNSENYFQVLANYTSLSNNYKNKEGVTSEIVPVSSGFIFDVDIDTNKAKVADLNNDYYYVRKTEAKVVAFEMGSRGFTCY